MSSQLKFNRALLALSLFMSLGLFTTSARQAIAHPVEQHQTASTEVAATTTDASTIPLFNDLGYYSLPISTSNPLVQRYFDQGMVLSFGFNHAEALRSFQQAAALDSTCAMCYWGMAYVLGPNINAAMEDSAIPTAWEAIQQAIALSDHATERERAYIQALAQRYSQNPESDRAALNLAYANAMREVVQRYPDDVNAAMLFAEALMDTTPWDYWQDNGEPKPEGVEIITTLESVLERSPYHPGALHLYIHAVEAKRPELAATAADRLRSLRLNAGHLAHMPSHIYIRIGRYQDAVAANQEATNRDTHYAQQHNPQGIYRIGYMPHNHHFLWFAAVMAGQRDVALEAARQTANLVDQTLMRQPGFGTLQHYASTPLYTQVKFGLWDDILATPAPDADLVYPTGVWHFARGMALVAKGRVQEAAQELTALQANAADPTLNGVTIWDINTTSDLLAIATEVLAGELAAKHGNYEQAIAHLQRGAELEDQLNYDEPSSWYSPVRHALGAVLLQAGRAADAEQVYREDLAKYPENGWSLYGLAQSLHAQGNSEAAQAVEERYEAAWQHADVGLQASRF
jgi:tetratricopeptide (TPR) repeat protein